MGKRIVADSAWIAPDFVPETFGRLTSISSKYKPAGRRHALQDFICECGEQVSRRADLVKHGISRSCGCLRKEVARKNSTTHGQYGHPIYAIWAAMVRRCENVRTTGYHNYGGRGITVHPDFRSFESFVAYIGNRPDRDHSIDRIDVNKGYEPGNIRWATRDQQANNTRCTRWIEHAGQVLTLAQWARVAGISTECMCSRLKSGWSLQAALETPVRTKKSSPHK